MNRVGVAQQEDLVPKVILEGPHEFETALGEIEQHGVPGGVELGIGDGLGEADGGSDGCTKFFGGDLAGFEIDDDGGVVVLGEDGEGCGAEAFEAFCRCGLVQAEEDIAQIENQCLEGHCVVYIGV